MKKMTLTIAAAASAVALALAGCSSSGREGGTGETSAAPSGSSAAGAGFDAGATIGIALPQKTSENWVVAEQLFNDDLKSAGYKPIVQFANNGVSEQQAQIESMIEAGAKVIVVGAIDGAQLGNQLQQAKDAGITVIAYDRLLTETPNVDLYVAFDPFQVGVEQGNSLLEGLAELKGDGPYNIELVAGSNDDANSKMFFDGAMSVLQPKIDDGTLTIKSGQTSQAQAATDGWQASVAQTRMEAIISANYSDGTSLDGILSPNDNLGRAVLQAAEAAGLETPVVTGQDSEKESVISIIQGKQYSTIYKDTGTLVAETIKQINHAQKGEAFDINNTADYDNGVKVVPAYLLSPVVVTKANVLTAYANDKTGLAEVVEENK